MEKNAGYKRFLKTAVKLQKKYAQVSMTKEETDGLLANLGKNLDTLEPMMNESEKLALKYFEDLKLAVGQFFAATGDNSQSKHDAIVNAQFVVDTLGDGSRYVASGISELQDAYNGAKDICKKLMEFFQEVTPQEQPDWTKDTATAPSLSPESTGPEIIREYPEDVAKNDQVYDDLVARLNAEIYKLADVNSDADWFKKEFDKPLLEEKPDKMMVAANKIAKDLLRENGAMDIIDTWNGADGTFSNRSYPSTHVLAGDIAMRLSEAGFKGMMGSRVQTHDKLSWLRYSDNVKIVVSLNPSVDGVKVSIEFKEPLEERFQDEIDNKI